LNKRASFKKSAAFATKIARLALAWLCWSFSHFVRW